MRRELAKDSLGLRTYTTRLSETPPLIGLNNKSISMLTKEVVSSEKYLDF